MNEATKTAIINEEQALLSFVAKRAGSLLRYEDVDDLVQSILLRALDRAPKDPFGSRGELRAWLFTVAAHYMGDRRSHWQALKREGGKVVRLTLSGESGDGISMPATDQSGPVTRAARRELLVLSTRALSALPDRDRNLVQWRAEDVPLEEQAIRLGLSYVATQRAGLRAFERFRKLFELVSMRHREDRGSTAATDATPPRKSGA